MDRDLGSSIGPGHLTDKEGGMVWKQTYNTLSRTERLSLLGNGHHLCSTGKFIIWVLSHLVRVDDLDFRFEFIKEHQVASSVLAS